ncbi:adenosylcobinamide-GDP ribazoletransferase [Salipiger sp.]|uniref:adenosylcobinamide-GDP ribazoletransferase n=1 Tax=Salipiger sp. TaxID=2078585 RepID=UPI003A97A097
MRRRRLPEIRLALMMMTRLPVGTFEGPAPEITHARWAFPLAGVPLALIVWAVLAGAGALGLPPLVGGLLGVTALVLATGGLHHDGLADFSDGMGGRDRAQRLAIMRDSRVGSYGVLALILAVGLGAAALAAFPSGPQTGLALLLCAVVSRLAILVVMDWLPPARDDGLGHLAASAGKDRMCWVPGGLLALLIVPFVGLPGIAALLVMAAAIGIVGQRAKARLGGQTGDVLGAVQLCSEIAGWVVLSAAL